MTAPLAMPAWTRPAGGVLVAIAITTTMDANGLTAFSALPLCPLLLLFWYLERLPRGSVGFAWGRPSHYRLAVLYPLAVPGLTWLGAATAGAVDIAGSDWKKVSLRLVLASLSTFVVVILTEEGFFRGWLWASLEKAGQNRSRILAVSSIAFALWHLSWVTLTADGRLPPGQVPVFIVNVAVIGAIWGMLRWMSGSVIVASLSHGVWNGITYALFGFGTHVGALGIKETALYGPETGLLGLLLNIVFAAVLWRAMAAERAAA